MVTFEDPPTTGPIERSSSARNAETSTSKTDAQLPEPMKKAYHFHNMAKHPLPYMVFLPVLFIILIALGWSQDDIVEDEVNEIWVPTKGDYAKDIEYAETYGNGGGIGVSSFAAMAKSRDGENLFTEDRLEEIRARMEAMGNTTVTYNGNTFTWQDICASNPFPYEFPCARLSPLDFFQEAKWEFDDASRVTWYREIMKNLLVKPRIPRFAAMTEQCVNISQPLENCGLIVALRTNPGALGLDIPPSPLSLFSDIGNLDMSDPCRICIEENYERTVNGLFEVIKPMFGVMTLELNRTLSSGTVNSTEGTEKIIDMMKKTAQLSQEITLNDVRDFYEYYVARGVYGSLGAPGYVAGYTQFLPLFQQCPLVPIPGTVCPSSEVPSLQEAEQALLNHADGTFSSVSTAGSPFPIWGSADGTGTMFGGSFPVSGSGINMGGTLLSTIPYLDLPNYGKPGWSPAYSTEGFVDPVTPDPLFTQMVSVEPTWAWFMASLIEADPETVCANGDLPGTTTGVPQVDTPTTGAALLATSRWCTQYNIPNENSTELVSETPYTVQHFARMWYDLLIDSDSFLNVVQGTNDPYTWTTGQGCGYSLGGMRPQYTAATESQILANASGELYYIDEGETVGAVDRSLAMGDVRPNFDYNASFPLQHVGVVQSLYAALIPSDIVNRVKNCKRPGGGIQITEEDASMILKEYKERMEEAWTRGWSDPNAGEVQFVGFYDDIGVVGTTARMLQEITLDSTALTVLSIALIAIFSVLFLFSTDLVESRVLITLVGVALVCLAFFAAIGFSILIGTKISITIAWTLPFVILGLGVDDMYIVLMAIKGQGGFGERDYLRAMKEVVVPVTMTSLVNAAMFGLMGGVSDIPAVNLAARAALYSVVLLYGAVIFCFPAYCYMDMKRQRAGRKDIFFCSTQEHAPTEAKTKDFRNYVLYDVFYSPLVLNKNSSIRYFTHIVILVITATLFGLGAYGISQREVGLGLEDFFPKDNQANVWARTRTESLASWTIGMSWGALNYTEPDSQMMMIKQLEDVASTSYVSEVNTDQLWMANFLIWGSRMCTSNFDRSEFGELRCGRDQLHEDTSTYCASQWVENKFGLRLKRLSSPSDDSCLPYEFGICRPGVQMHPDDLTDLGLTTEAALGKEFCPVANGWSDAKWQFCLREWRKNTGGGGRLDLEENQGSETDCPGVFENDENITWPIKYSAGPTMFASGLTTHQDTLNMMSQTRAFCDDHPDIHCWMSGIPFNYWTQYEDIFTVLVELGGYSILVGFMIAFVFLVTKLSLERRHPGGKVFVGSLIGALLIALTIILTLVSVVGLSILAGVSLTGFSNMSFVLSVGFAVEYAVHIVARWLRADMSYVTSFARVEQTMSFLMLPTFMSFVSSTIGVICLAFTEFEFNKTFFFKPLIIVMFTSYFFGCWFLPTLLIYVDFDTVKLGKAARKKSQYLTSSIVERLGQELPLEQPLEEPKPKNDQTAAKKLCESSAETTVNANGEVEYWS